MGKVPLVKGYRLTAHARFEMERRGIEEADIASVLSAPEQAEMVEPGRIVYQPRFERGEPSRMYLPRVFVDIDRDPAEVVTAYWSTKIDKYWRPRDEGDL